MAEDGSDQNLSEELKALLRARIRMLQQSKAELRELLRENSTSSMDDLTEAVDATAFDPAGLILSDETPEDLLAWCQEKILELQNSCQELRELIREPLTEA